MNLRTKLRRHLSDQFERDDFVVGRLRRLAQGSRLLDAGAGSQRYRRYCGHLQYRAQDFGQFTADEKPGFTSMTAGPSRYQYGRPDYEGDIWNISEQSDYFDAILCTEVFEHIPYPIDAVREFSRLLKPGGRLILTTPGCCLRHMDPFFFYSGFSDRFFERILAEYGFTIDEVIPVGDYYSWMSVEIARTAAQHSLFAKILLAPTFLWYLLKRKTPASVNTLCKGYHVVATKKPSTERRPVPTIGRWVSGPEPTAAQNVDK